MTIRFPDNTRQPIIRGVSTNVLSALIAQAITFGSTTIVTRLYGPSDFGLYANLVAWIMIATPLCNLGIPSALCYARSDRDAKILWNAALLLGLFGGFVIGVTGAILGLLTNVKPALPIVVGCGVFFATLNHIQIHWAYRAHDLRARLISQVGGSIIVAAGKIIAGIVAPSAPSLVIAQWANGIIASVVIRKQPAPMPNIRIKDQRRIYILTLARYADFLRFSGASIFTKYVFNAAPVLIVSSFVGLESAGQFALAFTVISAAMIVLSDAITDAVRRPIVEAFGRSEAEGRKLVAKITTRMPLVGMIPSAALFLGGEPLFDLAFGPGWQTAASLSRWLVLCLGLQFVIQPIAAAFPVRGLQKNLFTQELIFGSVRLTAFAACVIGYGNLELAVVIYSLLGVATSASIGFTYIRSFSHKPTRSQLRSY